MKPLPLPLRLAAGLAATARDRARDLPRQLTGLPVTVASQLLQASMRLQQQVTELAIKGDEVLSGLQPVEETPSWATFDEDEPAGEPFTRGDISVPEPRSRPNGFFPADEPRRSRFEETPEESASDPWQDEEQELAALEDAAAAEAESEATEAEEPPPPATPSLAGGPPLVEEVPKAPEWLPNYDVLSLPQVRARLRQFDPGQLGELLAYEKATANRPSFAGMLERRIERVAGGDAAS